MGQIPIYTSKEQPEVAASEVPLSADLATSNALVGNVLGMVQHVARRATEDDLAGAVGADGAYQNWHKLFLDDAETGLFSGNANKEAGEAGVVGAAGTYERYQVEAEAKFSELSEALANDEQRALFRESAGEHMRLAGNRVAAHEAAAADQRRRLSFGNHAMTESQRAAQLILQGKDAEAAKALEMSMAMVGQSMRGRSPEDHATAALALSSGYHGEVFQGKLSDDPLAAQVYLEENQAEIEPGQFDVLLQTADKTFDKQWGAELMQSVYEPERSLAEINDLIEKSDGTDIQKTIAQQAADDQRAIDLAEQFAKVRRQVDASEDAVHAALALFTEGTTFSDLPDDVIDQMTPAARMAARTIYTQQLAGETAPYNWKLEAEFYNGWLKALAGEATGFLKYPLSELYGSHDPSRLAHWQQRKTELTAPDAETQAKQNKRKLWYRLAERMMRDVAPDDARVRQDVIAYIDDWFEVNPGKVMEPGALKEIVSAFAEDVSTEETSTNASIRMVTGAAENRMTGGTGDDELAMSPITTLFKFGKEVLKKWSAKKRPKPKKGKDRYRRDNAGNEFVQLDDGKIDLSGFDAETAAEIGIEAAPIRLRRGEHNSDTDGGRGDIHAEARHGDQIRAIVDEDGNQLFEDVAEYIQFVGDNWTEVRENSIGNPVLIIRDETQTGSDKKQDTLIIELTKSPSSDFYDVLTTGPFRNRNLKKMKLLYTR